MNLQQLYISAVSFLAVFVMLTIFAGLMSLLTRVFPGKPAERKRRKPKAGTASAGPEPELVAAISAAMATALPGGRVTKIEEVK